AEEQGPARERPTEAHFQFAVLGVVEVEFVFHPRAGLRQRLPIHVEEHGGKQHQHAHGPFPRRRPGFVHASQSLPFQPATRSSSAITAALKTRNSVSPFSAEAWRGKPMCPASVRSLVIQARWAGAKALPQETSAAAR